MKYIETYSLSVILHPQACTASITSYISNLTFAFYFWRFLFLLTNCGSCSLPPIHIFSRIRGIHSHHSLSHSAHTVYHPFQWKVCYLYMKWEQFFFSSQSLFSALLYFKLLFIPCIKCIIRFMYVFMPQEAIRYIRTSADCGGEREREKRKPIK